MKDKVAHESWNKYRLLVKGIELLIREIIGPAKIKPDVWLDYKSLYHGYTVVLIYYKTRIGSIELDFIK